MFGLTAQLAVLLTCSCFFSLCDETQEVPAKTGEDVTLQCQGPRDESITVIEWSRPDLKSTLHVFFFRENRPYEHYQLPSFRGRVELRDPEMKNGDASVILKNVTVNDSGTYECVVSTGSSRRRKRDAEFRQFIILKVTESGHTAGQMDRQMERRDEEGGNKERGDEEGRDREGGDEEGGSLTTPFLTVAVVICVVVVVVVVVGFVLWKHQRILRRNPDPPPELQTLSPPSSNHCE